MILDDVDRASKAYRFGKFLGRCVWFGLGYVLGRKHRRPINQFPPLN